MFGEDDVSGGGSAPGSLREEDEPSGSGGMFGDGEDSGSEAGVSVTTNHKPQTMCWYVCAVQYTDVTRLLACQPAPTPCLGRCLRPKHARFSGRRRGHACTR